MNNRFPSIVVLGMIVAVLATIMNKWVFGAIVLVGGAALAVVVWKLVSRDMFTPPTVLLDEVKAKFSGTEVPQVPTSPEPDEKEPDGTHRIRRDEQ